MQLKTVCLSFVVALTICACGSETDQMPMPPDSDLIDMFVDLHMAEQTLNRVPIEAKDSVGLEVRKRIARKYDMSASQFDRVIREVQTDAEKAIVIYDSVDVRLNNLYRDNDLNDK